MIGQRLSAKLAIAQIEMAAGVATSRHYVDY